MNETLTTLTVEMVAVCLALAIGFVYSFEAWPQPWLLLLWTGSIFVVFSGYRAAVFARKKYFPPPAEPPAEAQAPKHPSLQWSAVEPNLPAATPEMAEAAAKLSIPGAAPVNRDAATMALSQVGLDAASEDPTAYLDAQELRPETQADLVAPEPSPIPLFAENTISLDQRTLSLAAIEAPASLRADSEAKTAMVEPVQTPEDPPKAASGPPTAARASAAPEDASLGQTEMMEPVQTPDDNSLAKTDLMEPVQVPEDYSVDQTTMLPAAETQDNQGKQVADSTQALSSDDLADKLRSRSHSGKTKSSKKRVITSARKPFEKPAKSGASSPAKPPTGRASAPPAGGAKSEDSVQVFDLNELQKLQRQFQDRNPDDTGEGS